MRSSLPDLCQEVSKADAAELLNRRLFFYDDFDKTRYATLPWFLTAGAAAQPVLDGTAGLWSVGGQTMKFASAASAGTSSEIHRYHARRSSENRFFFGGRFHISDAANPTNFGLYLGYRDGVNWTRAKILFTTAGVVSWVDAANASQQIVNRSLNASPSRARWHEFYIEADFKNNVWRRAIFDEIDASALSGVGVQGAALRQTADVTVPNQLDFAIDCTETVVSGSIYFDELYGGVLL